MGTRTDDTEGANAEVLTMRRADNRARRKRFILMLVWGQNRTLGLEIGGVVADKVDESMQAERSEKDLQLGRGGAKKMARSGENALRGHRSQS